MLPKTRRSPTSPIPDFNKDRTGGELFHILKNGPGNLPLEGDRAKAEQLWDLVNYIRTPARKQPPADQKTSN
ncbi:MAG TPA: cytochrome c [Terriglobales bacterium]